MAKTIDLSESQVGKSKSNQNMERQMEHIKVNSIKPKNEKLCISKAGEYYFCSQLSRRGFNASILPVDTGINIIAQQNIYQEEPIVIYYPEVETYNFQVKTTTTNSYTQRLSVNMLKDFWYKIINLVVIFWQEDKEPITVILPPRLIYMLTSGGYKDPRAPLKLDNDMTSIKIFLKEDHIYISNKHNDITLMKNRYDRIEPIGIYMDDIPEYAKWSDGKGLVTIMK